MEVRDTEAPEIEFWFDFGSNYSYLSVMRIGALARAAAVTIRWRPFVLGPIFKAFGWDTSPFLLQKEKGAHMWRDMERQCEKYALPWCRPSVFPRHSLLPVRIALYGEGRPWMPEFCRRVMLRNFSADLDIQAESAVAGILDELGLDADAIVAAAQGEANKLALRQRTDSAQARGIFGAPTFFARGEMFWGDDRLDDALALARN